MRAFFIAFALLASPLAAQQVTSAPGALLRTLDKTSGNTRDIEIPAGSTARLGPLSIVMRDCRYPSRNPSGNAYVALEVREDGRQGTVFSGWMIASAPALSAMEHARYDIWVIRCITS